MRKRLVLQDYCNVLEHVDLRLANIAYNSLRRACKQLPAPLFPQEMEDWEDICEKHLLSLAQEQYSL
jgi:hypothetical protein